MFVAAFISASILPTLWLACATPDLPRCLRPALLAQSCDLKTRPGIAIRPTSVYPPRAYSLKIADKLGNGVPWVGTDPTELPRDSRDTLLRSLFCLQTIAVVAAGFSHGGFPVWGSSRRTWRGSGLVLRIVFPRPRTLQKAHCARRQ
ncbi:hypothetical protein BJX64DRAFT_76494 [Aspergillus heterothallicus]